MLFPPNPIKTKAKWSLFGPKSQKSHFWLQNHFWGAFLAFWAQNALLAPKVILGEKCVLEQKVHFGDLTNSHTGSQICDLATMAPRKVIFAPKITFWLQNRFFASLAILGAKAHFLRKSALSRPHAADAYKTNGILIKTEPFLAQKRFWAQKCILEPKMRFWAHKAENNPK